MTHPSPELVIQGVPSNIILPPGARPVAEVTGDVFSICARLRDYDPNIRVVPVEADASGICFLICELGPDGDLREIMPVRELDGRIIERLQWMRAIPVKERLAAIQKELDADKKQRDEDSANLLYERLGGPMRTAIFRAGFTHMPDPQSRRPLNSTAKRAGRHA